MTESCPPVITLVDPATWGTVASAETGNHGTLLALTALPAIATAAGVAMLIGKTLTIDVT